MASGTFYDSVRMKQIEDTSIVDGDVVSGNLILTQHDGTQINAGNVVGPTGPAAPVYTSGASAYGVGTRYARVARLDGVNALTGAEAQFDFYGGQNYAEMQKYSAFVQVGQRGVDGIKMNVWERGLVNTGIVWYTRRMSSYVFEIWVKLPDYAAPVVVQPRQVWNGIITYDTVQTGAPSNLLQTNVAVFNEETETIISGLLEVGYRGGPAKVKINDILSTVEYPWLSPYNVSGSREVRLQKVGNAWWITGQNQDDNRPLLLNSTYWTTHSDANASSHFVHDATVVKLPSGLVVLSGLLRSIGTPPDGSLIATLPPGFAPDNETIYGVEFGDVAKSIRITPAGDIHVYGGAGITNQYLSLDGIVFWSAGVAQWTNIGQGGSAWANSFGPDAGWSTTFGTPGFWKDPYGFVWFRGLVKIGQTLSVDNTNIFTLPASHRTTAEMHVRSTGNSIFSYLGAKTGDGVNWKVNSASNVGGWISLAPMVIESPDAVTNNPWVYPLTKANGWVQYGTPGQFTTLKYLLREDGLRCLSGLINAGTYGASVATFRDREMWPTRGRPILAGVANAARSRRELSSYNASYGDHGQIIPAQGSSWFSFDGTFWAV